MPAPTIPPITTIVASNRPTRRARVGASEEGFSGQPFLRDVRVPRKIYHVTLSGSALSVESSDARGGAGSYAFGTKVYLRTIFVALIYPERLSNSIRRPS